MGKTFDVESLEGIHIPRLDAKDGFRASLARGYHQKIIRTSLLGYDSVGDYGKQWVFHPTEFVVLDPRQNYAPTARINFKLHISEDTTITEIADVRLERLLTWVLSIAALPAIFAMFLNSFFKSATTDVKTYRFPFVESVFGTINLWWLVKTPRRWP